jgi:hypothetical protein
MNEENTMKDRFTLYVDDTIVFDNQTGNQWKFDTYNQASKCWFYLTYGDQFGLSIIQVFGQYSSNLVEN